MKKKVSASSMALYQFGAVKNAKGFGLPGTRQQYKVKVNTSSFKIKEKFAYRRLTHL